MKRLICHLKSIDAISRNSEHVQQTLNDMPEFSTDEGIHRHINSLNGKVLLAEDDEDNQALIKIYVEQLGLKITVVSNGKEAVELAISDVFDLLLMDMQMPVMGGLEAITWLRQIGIVSPIVVLTANTMQSNRDECIAAGANDYLAKPINVDKLHQVLGHYLPESSNALPVGIPLSDPAYKQLVDRFMRKLPAMLSELTKAVHDSKWDTIQSLSHVLKGMGGNFGYPDITKYAAAINDGVTNYDYERVTEALATLLTLSEVILSEYNDD